MVYVNSNNSNFPANYLHVTVHCLLANQISFGYCLSISNWPIKCPVQYWHNAWDPSFLWNFTL